jgi:hypothetical protein
VLNSRYGFLFVSCNFTAEAGASDVVLGHQWWEGSNNGVVGKIVVRNSTLGGHLAPSPWAPSTTRTFTPKDPTGTTPVTRPLAGRDPPRRIRQRRRRGGSVGVEPAGNLDHSEAPIGLAMPTRRRSIVPCGAYS